MVGRSVDSKITVVDGVMVRSRLEAQWLRFLSLLDIDWVYEPARFDIPSNKIGYLPDFAILNKKHYVEVKPTWEIFKAECKRPVEFVNATGLNLLVVIGRPPGDECFLIIRGSTRQRVKRLKVRFFSSPQFSGITFVDEGQRQGALLRASTLASSANEIYASSVCVGTHIGKALEDVDGVPGR